MTLRSTLECSLIGTEEGYHAPQALKPNDGPDLLPASAWSAESVLRPSRPSAGRKPPTSWAVDRVYESLCGLIDTTPPEFAEILGLHVMTVRAYLRALDDQGRARSYVLPGCRTKIWKAVKP